MKVKIPGYVKRMCIELYELSEKIEKLKVFLEAEEWDDNFTVYREKMMEKQLEYMKKYAETLVERIGDAAGEIVFVKVNEEAEKKNTGETAGEKAHVKK